MSRENKIQLKRIINGDKDFTYNNERIEKLVIHIFVEYFKRKQGE